MQNRTSKQGFTLAEILVSLGILAIGMAMVAAIFPAAMEFNRASTNSTLGTIICENGLVLAELEMTAEDVDAYIGEDNPLLMILADDSIVPDNQGFLTTTQMRYPTGSGSSKTGFVVMIRKIVEADAYQIVTVAYRKTKKDNTVRIEPVGCTVDGKKITSGGAGKLRIGSPLINAKTGEFVIIESVNLAGTEGTLDIAPGRDMANISGNAFYTIVECEPNSGGTNGTIIPLKDMRRSPAIKGMSVVTGLSHKAGS